MFSTESPVDFRFFVWADAIVRDIHERNRIEWLDKNTLEGSRTGTLRGFIGHPENMAEAVVRVTLDSGWEHEVPLVDLMNARWGSGYARR